MRELRISVILALIDGRGQHLDPRVIRTLYISVAVRVIGAGVDFANPEELVDSVRKRAKLAAVVGGYAARASQRGVASAEEGVVRAFGYKFHRTRS